MRSRRSELRLSCASAPPLTERERAAKEKELETLQRRLTETQQSVDLAKTTLRRMVGEQSRGNDEMTDSKSTGIAGNADTSSSGDEESVVVNDGVQLQRQRDRTEKEATTTLQSLEHVEKTLAQQPQIENTQLSSSQQLVRMETMLQEAEQTEEKQQREMRRLEKQRAMLREQVVVRESYYVGDRASTTRR